MILFTRQGSKSVAKCNVSDTMSLATAEKYKFLIDLYIYGPVMNVDGKS